MNHADILQRLEKAVPAFPEEEKKNPLSSFREMVIIRTRAILAEAEDPSTAVKLVRTYVGNFFRHVIDDEIRPDNAPKVEMRDTFLQTLDMMIDGADDASI